MNKQEIIFDTVKPKKHSVRYDTTDESAAIASVYVKRKNLGEATPKKIKVTIEEVK